MELGLEPFNPYSSTSSVSLSRLFETNGTVHSLLAVIYFDIVDVVFAMTIGYNISL